MIHFTCCLLYTSKSVIATEVSQELPSEDIQKLSWLYGEATVENEENLKGCFIGPPREMITPWSTNAVEITQNMSLTGVLRIEEDVYKRQTSHTAF